MASDEAALRSELKEVEDLIAQTQDSEAGVNQEIGGKYEGTGTLDLAETSELFGLTQEQEAVLSDLERRRDALRHRLGID